MEGKVICNSEDGRGLDCSCLRSWPAAQQTRTLCTHSHTQLLLRRQQLATMVNVFLPEVQQSHAYIPDLSGASFTQSEWPMGC